MTDSPPSDSAFELPADVADEMVRRLFQEDTPGAGDRILFPGMGSGTLVAGVARYCERNGLEFPEGVALETDADLVSRGRERFGNLPLEILRADFLSELPNLGEFEYVLSDPPVGELRGLPPDYREDLATRFETIDINSAGRDEDLYLAFFERGLELLAPAGRLVFLTPDFTTRRGRSAIPELKRRLATFRVEDIDEVSFDAAYEDAAIDLVISTVEHADPTSEAASNVDYDSVQEALSVPYEIDVRDIMTPDPLSFYPSDNVNDVYLSLIRNDYDAAPVVTPERGRCVGVVSKAELTGVDTGRLEDGHITDPDESRLLSVTASFAETLDRLQRHRFCLVGDLSDVRGIATRFDLNSLSVYYHLYAAFARFEIGLRNAIRASNVNWEDALLTAGVPARHLREIEQRYGDNPALAQDVLDTMLFSDLLKIVEHSVLYEALEFDRLRDGVYLSDINDVRGSVAHYQPLIHTLDLVSFTGRRTTADFAEIYVEIQQCLTSLETHGFV